MEDDDGCIGCWPVSMAGLECDSCSEEVYGEEFGETELGGEEERFRDELWVQSDSFRSNLDSPCRSEGRGSACEYIESR